MAALTPEIVPGLVAGGASARADTDLPAKLSVGDAVQMKNTHPHTHTRLARYVRGKTGVVHRHHGAFHFNDAVAHGKEEVQHCYSVKFTMQEIWGEGHRSDDYLYIDMFDDYMDKV